MTGRIIAILVAFYEPELGCNVTMWFVCLKELCKFLSNSVVGHASHGFGQASWPVVGHTFAIRILMLHCRKVIFMPGDLTPKTGSDVGTTLTG